MKKIKSGKKDKIKKLIIIIIIVVFLTFKVLDYTNKKISPIIMQYASLEAKKFSSIIINKAINKHITEELNTNDMFTVTTDSNGEIKSIDFNTTLINKFLTETTNSIQINLRNVEKGNIDSLEFLDSITVDYDKSNLKKGIIYNLTPGVITGNVLLSNVGPKIPVKISLIGDATSNISTTVKNYGINNAMIEVYVNLKISEKVMVPFYNKLVEVSTKAPVAMKVITGTVPKYYANGITDETPSVVIPTEE